MLSANIAIECILGKYTFEHVTNLETNSLDGEKNFL